MGRIPPKRGKVYFRGRNRVHEIYGDFGILGTNVRSVVFETDGSHHGCVSTNGWSGAGGGFISKAGKRIEFSIEKTDHLIEFVSSLLAMDLLFC